MTLCGRRRLWDGDMGQPGGRINLCGIYGGDYSSRGGGVVVYNNKLHSLILEQSLNEAWNPTTS